MRQIPVKESGIKNQHIVIDCPGGKSYIICAPGQMQFLIEVKTVEIINSLQEEISQGKFTEDSLKQRIASEVDKWKETCGYATLDWVMAKMTPAQKETWKAQYRFGGVNRRKS